VARRERLDGHAVTAPPEILALTAVLGLAVGSFLNVVIYRVPRGQSIVRPASHCTTCGDRIRPWHNVPVLGWLLLRGRCAGCGDAISVRYPLVETGTAALFVAITLRFGLTLQLPAYLYLAAVGIVLALINVDVRRLPDAIVLPSYVVSLLLLMPAGAVNADVGRDVRAIAGYMALLAAYFVLALAYPTAVALDEVKVAGLAGLFLGWLSWSALVLGMLLSFLVASVAGAAVASAGRTAVPAVTVRIPMGTCLLAATAVSLFVAAPLSGWYGSLLPT
jgi:leader peptidase (prepilin peptidase)/N-methyltransferase